MSGKIVIVRCPKCGNKVFKYLKVGLGKTSLAKFYIESVIDVRLLLSELVKRSGDI